MQVSRAAKARRPDLPVVWGGWHPSLFGARVPGEPSVDVTVQAQGEATFAEIVRPAGARGDRWTGCPGCCFRARRRRGARQNPPRPLQDLNRFRPHDYALLPVERYYALKGKRQLDYISSQGCPSAARSAPIRSSTAASGWASRPSAWAPRSRRSGGATASTTSSSRTRPSSPTRRASRPIARRAHPPEAAHHLGRHHARGPGRAPARRGFGDVQALRAAAGARRRRVGLARRCSNRIKKDIKLEQVFVTARAVPAARRRACIFPFIVGFPGRERRERRRPRWTWPSGCAPCRPTSRRRSSTSSPTRARALTDEAVRDGYALPCTLEEWAALRLHRLARGRG